MIYLLEDDSNIRALTAYALNNSGYETVGFERPSEFWAALEEQLPSLLLLDIMLPEEDGLEILRRLRASAVTADMPVILLTAKDTEFDKVVGLDLGADDYVAKPFGIMELISRVRAVLRRAESRSSGKDITIGQLVIVPSRRSVTACGEPVSLTFKEFQLLMMLASKPGTVFTRDVILSSVWGYDYDGENRTVDVHIRTLRQKLGECGELIETVRGVGYRMIDMNM